MWVADTDFASPIEVTHALEKRARGQMFGYAAGLLDPLPIQEAVVYWTHSRFDWKIKAEEVSFTGSVVPALFFAIQCFSEPGDGVVIQTPV
jgi:cystathionine beta-lyase